jgi:hypothetical protein
LRFLETVQKAVKFVTDISCYEKGAWPPDFDAAVTTETRVRAV